MGIGETKTTCEIGTQTCKFLQQESEQQRRNVQCSCVDLSTDIEGLKLDIVIAESKAAGNFQSNKQAIDQLRNELNSIKSRNRNCLSYNANLNQNENNFMLQNQPDVQSQTKELNNIVSTQDLVSVIMKADPVVIIESENHNQITRSFIMLIKLLKGVQILNHYVPLFKICKPARLKTWIENQYKVPAKTLN